PAQYFHLLRRQVRSNYRKPLVIMTPKSLLRHPKAVSTVSDLSGGAFSMVLDDPKKPYKATKVILCSGKIYYQLIQRCQDTHCKDIAVVRLEQFYPFPKDAVKAVLDHYRHAESWCWVQEEPENMGGWQFVRPQLDEIVGKTVTYIGRPAAASPATGFPNVYRQQQNAISDEAVGPLKDNRVGVS
ncbi:MAG: 2-oxoglutarate dehydrogenase E1 component, partial [Desulfobacteraceae bacterium]